MVVPDLKDIEQASETMDPVQLSMRKVAIEKTVKTARAQFENKTGIIASIIIPTVLNLYPPWASNS